MSGTLTDIMVRERASDLTTLAGRRIKSSRPLILGTLAFVLIVLTWQMLSAFELISPFIISSPRLVAEALRDQLQQGQLYSDLGVTAMEFAIGFTLGTILGLIVGFACYYRIVAYALDPFLWIGYSAPTVALFPVIVLLLGQGTTSVIVLTTKVVMFAVALNVASAIRDVRHDLVLAARSFCATDMQILRKVMIPAAVPMLGVSVRLGIGRGLVGVLVAEFFASDKGLGYRIAFYGHSFQMAQMLANVVIITILGVLFTRVAEGIEARAGAWREV